MYSIYHISNWLNKHIFLLCIYIYRYIHASGISSRHTKKPAENRFDCCFRRSGENLALVEQRDDKARPIHPTDHERRKCVRMPSECLASWNEILKERFWCEYYRYIDVIILDGGTKCDYATNINQCNSSCLAHVEYHLVQMRIDWILVGYPLGNPPLIWPSLTTQGHVRHRTKAQQPGPLWRWQRMTRWERNLTG